MATFKFEDTLNQNGKDVLEAYTQFLSYGETLSVQEKFAEKALRSEAKFIAEAMDKRISAEEMKALLEDARNYKVAAGDILDAAAKFVSDVVDSEEKHRGVPMRVNMSTAGHTRVILYKSIGMKPVTAEKCFGVSHDEALDLSNNGFLRQFTDTYIRHRAEQLVEDFRLPRVTVEVSHAAPVKDRKHFYDVTVCFSIPLKNLNTKNIKAVLDRIQILEENLAEFAI